jgi:hypothetical protein
VSELAIALRYPVTAQHPPLNVRVLVQWNGRTFKAARIYHPRTKKLCWVTTRNDSSGQYLPPKRKRGADTWGENPEWWQPENPKEWRISLPAPLKLNGVSAEGVMADIRRGPRRGAEAPDELSDRLPWWWLIDSDAPRLTYCTAGQITRQMAEGRVMRAVAASGIEETKGLFGASPRVPMFNELSQAAQAFLKDDAAKQGKIQPSLWSVCLHLDRNDHDDWLTAMSWFAALNPPNPHFRDNHGKIVRRKPWSFSNRQIVLLLRARCVGGPMSWRSMGKVLSLDQSRCRELYNSAIDRVHRIANGMHAQFEKI